ncbi:MAG: glycerophosphodiester phosphodiesterase [Halobacteriovoraceae bacterium]|nr:glycerophosphodiester phosphodiesterase [Halobacteriovoraceae bacterium]
MKLTIALLFMTQSYSIFATGVIAHRGASGYAPENTIAAILKAIDLGADYVEIDVHMTADRKIVVFHDEGLERTTNGNGKIHNKTLLHLSTLDAGSWYDKKFAAEKIPTLENILLLDFKKTNLIIEVKNTNNIYNNIEKQIVEIVKESNFNNHLVYKSFGTEVLLRFKELDPKRDLLYVTIGPVLNFLVIDDGLRIGSLFEFDYIKYIQVHRLFMSKSLVKKAHKLNKKIIVWDVQKKSDIKKMKELGVDFIETDFPDYVK